MKNRTLISALFCLLALSGCGFDKEPGHSISYETPSVSLELVIHTEALSVHKGGNLNFRAQLLESGNHDVPIDVNSMVWKSSNDNIATISSSGQLLAKSKGTTTITASMTEGDTLLSTSIEITVLEVTLSRLTLVLENENSIPAGVTLPFQVIGEYSDGNSVNLTDSSSLLCDISDSSVAQLNLENSEISIKGMRVGETTLKCALKNTNIKVARSISVSKAIPVELLIDVQHLSLAVGLSTNILPSVKLSDGSVEEITNAEEVEWEINDHSLVSIHRESNQTKILATSPGTVTLTGRIQSKGISKKASIVITPAIFSDLNATLDKAEIPAGFSTAVHASAKLTDRSSIDVTLDPEVSWSLVPTGIARLETKEDKLVINTLKSGQVTLIASLNDGKIRAQATLVVSEPVVTALNLSSDIDSLPIGLSHSVKAWATLSDGSINEVSESSGLEWTVDNAEIATFNRSTQKGTVTGLHTGEVNITGTLFDKWQSTTKLTVTEAIVTGINFDDTDLSLPVGLGHYLKINASLSDGSTTDISNSPEIQFIIENNQIADLDNEESNRVIGQNIGTTTITASAKFNSIEHQSDMALEIIPPVIKELVLESANTEITTGFPLILQVIATMTDGTEVNITNSSILDWDIDKTNVASLTVSTDGVIITGIEQGDVNVSISADSFPSRVTTNRTFTVIPKNYGIQLEEDSASPLMRSVFEGYDIDDVKVRHNELTNFDLLNATPRYLNNPLVKINHQHFRLDGFVSPFQSVHFELPEWFDEPIASAYFVDEQPLFKAHIRAYADVRQNDDKYAQPTTENVYQYEKELRGFKQLMNNYDYNHRFIGFIQSYMNSRTRMIRHEDHWCEIETLLTSTRSIESSSDHFAKFKGNDTSPHTLKHVSLIANKPSATYMMLTREANGVATVGDGWLSVRDFRLFSEGATSPKTTYLHEKMHNHGFGHKGGMTYGYPAETGKYVNQSWTQFYEDGAVEASTPTLASQYELKDLGEQFKLEISFLDKSTSRPSNRYLDKFILLTTSLSKLKQSYAIDNNNNVTEIFPEPNSGYDHTYIFDDIGSIRPQSLSESNSNVTTSRLAFIFDKPEQATTDNVPTSMIFIGGSKEDTKQQANLVINYSGSGGFVSEDGQLIYLTKKWEKSENDVFINQVDTHSPLEAEQFCKDKGLSLGTLKPFRSNEMMNFQTKYQKYGSQVGLSFENGMPMAVSVPTTYRPNTIKEVEKGAVIVCSK